MTKITIEQPINPRKDFVDSLRACADFFEQHPDLPLPENQTLNVWNLTRDAIVKVAQQGSWQKHYAGSIFYLSRDFGNNLTLEYNAPRETVCRKVVKGMITVPAKPEQELEDVEWVCSEPLLAP